MRLVDVTNEEECVSMRGFDRECDERWSVARGDSACIMSAVARGPQLRAESLLPLPVRSHIHVHAHVHAP
eukprot:5430558-Prymnesium_polylepis.1